jgi:UDP-N-acetylglucosamine--N-acetylmuramyl-(pentapeptide) pyrophosphoryl-undecaprenol N-acetylglucosamine transferase
MNIVIAAGGTGGHLYPAIALAREFQRIKSGVSVLFVGTTRGMESRVVPHEGFPLRLITAKPFMGMGRLGAAKALLALPAGIWESVRLLKAQRADLVIGVGGYTSPAVLLAAALLRRPRVILEPNSYPGFANKLLGPLVQLVFLAFGSAAEFFPRTKVRVVGTPLRQEFVEPVHAQTQGSEDGRMHLVIFGGSQGAKAINGAMVEALPYLADIRDRLLITHQTGEADRESVAQGYAKYKFRADVRSFLYDMPLVLRSADLVIARAGAMTIAELAACGCPAILVPLPQAIYNHQAKNAAVMESAGAAIVLPQYELSGERLASTICSILTDAQRLQDMRAQSLALRRVDAAGRIVEECLSLLGRSHEADESIGVTGS